MGKIIMNKLDFVRIKQWINGARQSKPASMTEAARLLAELENAVVVEPQEVPSDVVTMNSVVKLTFLNQEKQLSFQLVYPDAANFKENKISIFSPVATALIGYRVGDTIEWIVPAGITKIRIDEIVYQPEASGDYDL